MSKTDQYVYEQQQEILSMVREIMEEDAWKDAARVQCEEAAAQEIEDLFHKVNHVEDHLVDMVNLLSLELKELKELLEALVVDHHDLEIKHEALEYEVAQLI